MSVKQSSKIDCRDHDWFESRAQACTALVCVDYGVSLKQADGRWYYGNLSESGKVQQSEQACWRSPVSFSRGLGSYGLCNLPREHIGLPNSLGVFPLPR
ncbi:hypothetical protein MJ581_25055 [Escherichia coli]|nr:hypothetical protein MJ581_25055 [Escherichia coli]